MTNQNTQTHKYLISHYPLTQRNTLTLFSTNLEILCRATTKPTTSSRLATKTTSQNGQAACGGHNNVWSLENMLEKNLPVLCLSHCYFDSSGSHGTKKQNTMAAGSAPHNRTKKCLQAQLGTRHKTRSSAWSHKTNEKSGVKQISRGHVSNVS